jgi:hypothetical protein
MSITAIWDNPEQTILRYTFRENWTWDELFEAIEKGRAMQDGVQHRVDIILDMSRGIKMPGGAIAQFKRVAGVMHPNTGIRVMVTQDRAVLALFDVFARLYRTAAERYRITRTLESAYAIIAEQRAAIREDSG